MKFAAPASDGFPGLCGTVDSVAVDSAGTSFGKWRVESVFAKCPIVASFDVESEPKSNPQERQKRFPGALRAEQVGQL